jgi:hypothetical protein
MIIRVFKPTIHAGKESEFESFLRDTGATRARDEEAGCRADWAARGNRGREPTEEPSWPDPNRWTTSPPTASAADRDPDSPTATSGFDDRAQEAADRNDAQDPYDYDDYDIE